MYKDKQAKKFLPYLWEKILTREMVQSVAPMWKFTNLPTHAGVHALIFLLMCQISFLSTLHEAAYLPLSII